MKYYLFEKNVHGGNNYRQYSLEELKDFFKDEEAPEDYNETWKRIENVEDFKRFVEEYVNNYQGMHYHDYYIEEV